MLKNIGIFFVTILTSFYFFPFEFTFLPGFNTKMVMAGVGLILLCFNLAKGGDGLINKDFFKLSLWGLLVSLVGLFSVIFNDTNDYTYATYIVSMWVWLGGAYVVINAYRKLHGYVSIELVCNYLIAVGTLQCIIALSMDLFPAVKNFVDSFLGSEGSMGKVEKRLYGIGASLDVAGSRLSAVLVIIAYRVKSISTTGKDKLSLLYLICFFIIIFIGNMISRSTIVGAGIAMAYWFFAFKLYKFNMEAKKIYLYLLGMLLILIPIICYLYANNPIVYRNMRFAFEGFFSLAEKGRWEVHSNEMLKEMYIFPDNMKTWIMGDGYFDNPYNRDPYYVGPNFPGFYMATDVGYLRFIYYFGLIGLISFSFYMFRVARTCMCKFPDFKMIFVLLLIVNFAMWFKVSTDIFLTFALFLCVNESEGQREKFLAN